MTSKRLGAREIKLHWQKNARRFGPSYEASWSDRPMIDMEVRQILSRLDAGDRVLDAGCGNGYSAIRLASQKNIELVGMDLIPEMIRNARGRLRGRAALAKKIRFRVGDITAIKEPADTYDKVISVRVLINLVSAGARRRALRECARVLKPGGRLILSEAMRGEWERLNALRKEWELAPIPMPAFNRYLNEKELLRQAAAARLRLVESADFSSTYFVGTRVLKPLLARFLKNNKLTADPLSHWNRWFSELPAWGDYGTQKLFVFEKS